MRDKMTGSSTKARGRMGKFILYRDPIPLQRHRHLPGGHGGYSPQRKEIDSCRWELKMQHQGQELFYGPLALDIVFFMNLPESRIRRTRVEDYHQQKPDLSNLIKFVEDVANTILFPDDKQIALINACKIYGLEPKTEFTITELNDGYY